MRRISSSSGHDVRLPLRLRTASDVATLQANARAVRRLPRNGVEVGIAGLDPVLGRRLERRIRAYIRACGCAEGATAALLAVLLAIAFVTSGMWTRGPQWSDLAALAIGLVVAVLAGGLGKLLGLAVARLRFELCCRRVIASLDADRAVHAGRIVA